MPDDATYPGFEAQNSSASDVNEMTFLFRQMMGRVWTSAVVMVTAVNSAGELAPVGLLDVQPLVHQIDGNGLTTPHGIINNLPYFRLQGGVNAIILDPQVGDIGLAIFASRDISSVKASKSANAPGSFRRNDPADGLYIGGFLNGTPTQYIRFTAVGIEMVSPQQIKLQAPDIQFVGPTHTSGAVTGDSTAEYAGEGTFNGHTVGEHTHGGVQTGGGNTGTPTG